MAQQPDNVDTNAGGPNADLLLSRRSMLGAVGAGLTAGLAGCIETAKSVASTALKTEFTGPIIGFKGGTFAHWGYGPRPVTLRHFEAAPIVETRNAGDLGDVEVTLNTHATSYSWQLRDDYLSTVGFLSIPIPKLGGSEFAGPIDDPLDTLVTGEWGLTLFNRMKFTDEPVEKVEYGTVNLAAGDTSSSSSNSLFESDLDDKRFSVVATNSDGASVEYAMILVRFRTNTAELSEGVDDSYVFLSMGTLMENIQGTFDWPAYVESDAGNSFGLITEPSV